MKLNQILRSRSGSRENLNSRNTSNITEEVKTSMNPAPLMKKTLSGVHTRHEPAPIPVPKKTKSDPPNFKISKLNNDALKEAFLELTSNFASELDLYYKNYNKFVKESKNKIDIQVKASKREKAKLE